MLEQERAALVAACAVNGLGGKTIRKLGELLSAQELGWEAFWSGGVHFWQELGLTERMAESVKKFKAEYSPTLFSEYLNEREIIPILETSKWYPQLLRELDSRPAILFSRGALVEREELPVAVVGTRKMTSYGKMATDKIVSELVLAGATIVSGFMYGIDSCAHQSAIAAGGRTIGILGFGFGHLFPNSQSHRKLFEEVLAHGGAFYTEFPPNTPAHSFHFPARNRIVAGMSLGVVVVEAALKSGSHITAGFAADEGRAVCAVPGPITSEYSRGTKELINEGAALVTSGFEVLEEVGGFARQVVSQGTKQADESKFATSPKLPALQNQILAELSQFPCSVGQLSTQLMVPVSQIQHEVTLLELMGKVERRGGELAVR